MIDRLSRALHVVPPQSPVTLEERAAEIEERVEAVIERIDSLEARVSQLEEAAGDGTPNDARDADST